MIPAQAPSSKFMLEKYLESVLSPNLSFSKSKVVILIAMNGVTDHMVAVYPLVNALNP